MKVIRGRALTEIRAEGSCKFPCEDILDIAGILCLFKGGTVLVAVFVVARYDHY